MSRQTQSPDKVASTSTKPPELSKQVKIQPEEEARLEEKLCKNIYYRQMKGQYLMIVYGVRSFLLSLIKQSYNFQCRSWTKINVRSFEGSRGRADWGKPYIWKEEGTTCLHQCQSSLEHKATLLELKREFKYVFMVLYWNARTWSTFSHLSTLIKKKLG